jgi:hypothetical protein
MTNRIEKPPIVLSHVWTTGTKKKLQQADWMLGWDHHRAEKCQRQHKPAGCVREKGCEREVNPIADYLEKPLYYKLFAICIESEPKFVIY